MKIYCSETSEMVEIVYGLVKKGLTFETRFNNNEWVITLTGGF